MSCVFCEIVSGQGPANMVREWPDVIAFTPLKPAVDGHTLVVPRRHVDDFAEDPELTAATVLRAAELAAEMGGPMNAITSKGREASQTVFHLHIHLVPRRADDDVRLWLRNKE